VARFLLGKSDRSLVGIRNQVVRPHWVWQRRSPAHPSILTSVVSTLPWRYLFSQLIAIIYEGDIYTPEQYIYAAGLGW
jgi:hypothetical protein